MMWTDKKPRAIIRHAQHNFENFGRTTLMNQRLDPRSLYAI